MGGKSRYKGPSKPKVRPKESFGWRTFLKQVSLAGIIGAIGGAIGIYASLPTLTITRFDKRSFSSESLVNLKNSGMLAMVDVTPVWQLEHFKSAEPDVKEFSGAIDFHLDNQVIGKVEGGESFSLSAMPPFYGSSEAENLQVCEYYLLIKYRPDFILFKGPELTRRWYINLRNPPNAPFEWNAQIVE
jgi:hypothetical protein